MNLKVNPIYGVVLLIVCIVAQFAFSKFHADSGTVVTTVMGIAVAIVLGGIHQVTKTELVQTKDELSTLRASMRPKREPSMSDIQIPPTDKPGQN